MDERRNQVKRMRKGKWQKLKRAKDGEVNGQGWEKHGRGAPAQRGACSL